MQDDARNDLLDISHSPDPIIAIDCCGWHFALAFQKDIIMLETVTSAKQFKFGRDKISKLVDDRADGKLSWPALSCEPNGTVVFDRSPMLKYLSIGQLASVIEKCVAKYCPDVVLIRGHLAFIDDNRCCDRFYNWAAFTVENYVVTRFLHDIHSGVYEIFLKQCK